MDVTVCLLDEGRRQERLLSRVDGRTLRVRHPRLRKALRYVVDSCTYGRESTDMSDDVERCFRGLDVSVCVLCDEREEVSVMLSKTLFQVFKRARTHCEDDTTVYSFNVSAFGWIGNAWRSCQEEYPHREMCVHTTIRTHKQAIAFLEEAMRNCDGADATLFNLSVERASPESTVVRRGTLRWLSAPLTKKKKKPLGTISHNSRQRSLQREKEEENDYFKVLSSSEHLSVVLCLPVTTYKSSVGALMWTERVRRQRKSGVVMTPQDSTSKVLEMPKMLSVILAEAHRLWTELQVHVKTLHQLRDLNIHTFTEGCKYESRARHVIERCAQGKRDVNRILKCLLTGKNWTAGERLRLGYRHASELALRMLGKVERLSMESSSNSSDNQSVASSISSHSHHHDINRDMKIFLTPTKMKEGEKHEEEKNIIVESPIKIHDEDTNSSSLVVVNRERWETLVLKGLRDAIQSKRMLFGETLDDFSCVFDAFDRNGDGRISASELVEGLRRLDIAVSYVQACEVFEHADTDGDGNISYREFLKMLRVENVVSCHGGELLEDEDVEEKDTIVDVVEKNVDVVEEKVDVVEKNLVENKNIVEKDVVEKDVIETLQERTVEASRKLLQAHIMMNGSHHHHSTNIVKSASPLVGATALARIFRRYERRRCRDTLRIWFANAVLGSPLKPRDKISNNNNNIKETTSWALIQVWRCAAHTRSRILRTMHNISRRHRRDLLDAAISTWKSFTIKNNNNNNKRENALICINLILRHAISVRLGYYFRRWIVFTTSKHVLSNHTNRTVRQAIRVESAKWETKIRKAKEAALRVVEQSRANTQEKIELARLQSCEETKKHQQYVAIRALDSMMRLTRLRVLSSKFRKWHLLSLNIALYVDFPFLSFKNISIYLSFSPFQRFQWPLTHSPTHRYERLTSDVDQVRTRVMKNVNERVRLEREQTIESERKRASLISLNSIMRRYEYSKLQFAFSKWYRHVEMFKAVNRTRIRITNRVRVMFALTRLEAMFRLRTSLAMGVSFRIWRHYVLSCRSSDILQIERASLEQKIHHETNRERQCRGAIVLCSVSRRLDMKIRAIALRRWQNFSKEITLNTSMNIEMERVREEASETIWKHGTELESAMLRASEAMKDRVRVDAVRVLASWFDRKLSIRMARYFRDWKDLVVISEMQRQKAREIKIMKTTLLSVNSNTKRFQMLKCFATWRHLTMTSLQDLRLERVKNELSESMNLEISILEEKATDALRDTKITMRAQQVQDKIRGILSRRRLRTLRQVWSVLRHTTSRNRRLFCLLRRSRHKLMRNGLSRWLRYVTQSAIASAERQRVEFNAHMNAETHRAEVALNRIRTEHVLRRLEHAMCRYRKIRLYRSFCSWRIGTYHK